MYPFKATFGTKLATFGNAAIGIIAGLANNTEFMQAIGPHSGYVIAASLIANALSHAMTGNVPIVGTPTK